MLAQIREHCTQCLLEALETSSSQELRFVVLSPPMAGVLAGIVDPAVTGSLGHNAFSPGCNKLTSPISPATPAAPSSATATANTTNKHPDLPSLVALLEALQTQISALLEFMRLPKILNNYLDDLIKLSGALPPCIRDLNC